MLTYPVCNTQKGWFTLHTASELKRRVFEYDLHILQGRIAFGNKLLETTLCFKFESATGIYTTSQANSSLDEFMHIVKCQGKNVRVMLSPSPCYNGPTDE